MKKYHSIPETEKPNDIGQNTWFPDWKPFKVLCPADQKLTWNSMRKGGATKSMEHFCPYCVIPLSEINCKNNVYCSHCQSLTVEERQLPFDMPWECLHHELISDDIIQKLQEELTSSVGPNIHGAYEEISSKTKIKLYEDGNKHKLESIDSIDYEPALLKSLENLHALLIEEAAL